MEKRLITYLAIFISFFLLFSESVFAQKGDGPFLKLAPALKEKNTVSAEKQFIAGITCKTCSIFINDTPVKRYNTGTFALEVKLKPGINFYYLKAVANSKTVEKTISFQLDTPVNKPALDSPRIEYITVFPKGDLIVQQNEEIFIEVKAMPGAEVQVSGTVLHEIPVGKGADIAGIYKGTFKLNPNDTVAKKLTATLRVKDGRVLSRMSSNTYTVMPPGVAKAIITKSRLAHLKFGWGEDRLGGAKVGYLDSLIPLKVLGKYGIDYKVELTPSRSAYIESEYVDTLPKGYTLPPVLTGKITIEGNEKNDFVRMSFERRIPYESRQLTDPSIIEVDLFGAVSNTNWITQLRSAKEIERLEVQQVSDAIFRLRIFLKHKQHWGYSIYYERNQLVIKVKVQPRSLLLKDLIIAVDAGHGGTNSGAPGLTGVLEKDLVLDVSLKLQSMLEREGAKVIMTRTTEGFFDNRQRILFYRDSTPDILVSVHLNSSVDPINVGGTMMFYRYAGFRLLNEKIYTRMQELGLQPAGITNSFNFMLNSPTEYPNALVEALFLSNLAEEEMVVDPVFRQQMAEKIMLGLKDFLSTVSKDN